MRSSPLSSVASAAALTLLLACAGDGDAPADPASAEATAPPPDPGARAPLPTWEQARGGRPKGAKSPAVPVLVVRADGSDCFKLWFDARKLPDEARLTGGVVLAPAAPPPDGAVAIQCPAGQVAEVLAHQDAATGSGDDPD